MSQKTRVLIVEDEALFRDLLRISLGSQPDLELIGVAASGEEAVLLAEDLQPDIVLMDIELGAGINGLEAGQRIKARRPKTGIVILSMHRDKQYLASLPVDKASGWSYLLKQSVADTATLVRAIEGAAAGLVVMDPAIVGALRPRPTSSLGRLTPRQLEVLEFMAEGYSNAGIARKLFLGEKSVENYINAIFQELGVSREQPIHPRVRAVLIYLEETQSP